LNSEFRSGLAGAGTIRKIYLNPELRGGSIEMEISQNLIEASVQSRIVTTIHKTGQGFIMAT
jgi:hypothetical protein